MRDYEKLLRKIKEDCQNLEIETIKNTNGEKTIFFRINDFLLEDVKNKWFCDSAIAGSNLIVEEQDERKKKGDLKYIFLKSDKMPLKLNFTLNALLKSGWAKLDFYTDAQEEEFTVLTIHNGEGRRAISWKAGLRDFLLCIEEMR